MNTMLEESVITILGRCVIGAATSEDIVDWAVQQLAASQDTPHLRILAGLFQPLYRSEVEKLFSRCLDELDISVPGEEAALARYAQQIAQALLDDFMEPYEAAHTLYHIWIKSNYGNQYGVWGQLHSALSDFPLDDEESWSYSGALPGSFKKLAKNKARQFLDQMKNEARLPSSKSEITQT